MNPSPCLFDACVPVLQRYLAGLERIVAAVEALPAERQAPVLQARLAPDMLPLYRQVDTASYFALRTAYPLAGLELPPHGAVLATTAALRENLRRTHGLVAVLTPRQFDDAPSRRIRERAGHAAVELPAQRFLSEFALPNFFFHLGMAYAIARAQGCALGKADFDGFHAY